MKIGYDEGGGEGEEGQEGKEGVVTRAERHAVAEEVDGVDIGLVAGEGAAHFRVPRVPDLGKRIAATGDEDVVLERRAADPHHVTVVVLELLA